MAFNTLGGPEIKVKEQELVEKARQLGLKPQWQEFWRQDQLFKNAGYSYDSQRHELVLLN
jgi:hypothetical protein